MKTQRIIESPVAKRLYDLKRTSTFAILNGKCRKARTAQKEFAKLAINNFSTAVNLPKPFDGSFSLFSDYGLNTLKFMIFKLFTKKTPEEKKLKEMMDEYRTEVLFDVRQ